MDYDTINYLIAQKAEEITNLNFIELSETEIKKGIIGLTELKAYCEFAWRLRENIET